MSIRSYSRVRLIRLKSVCEKLGELRPLRGESSQLAWLRRLEQPVLERNSVDQPGRRVSRDVQEIWVEEKYALRSAINTNVLAQLVHAHPNQHRRIEEGVEVVESRAIRDDCERHARLPVDNALRLPAFKSFADKRRTAIPELPAWPERQLDNEIGDEPVRLIVFGAVAVEADVTKRSV